MTETQHLESIREHVVVDEWFKVRSSFDTWAEAAEWARENEFYLGQFWVLPKTDPRIRYSWRSESQTLKARLGRKEN